MTWNTLGPSRMAVRLSLGCLCVLLIMNAGISGVTANGKIAFFNQTFNSSIVLGHSVLTFNQSDFKKAFSFRTCSTNGQLLYQRGSSGDYFSISVINGSLDVRWRGGSVEEAINIGTNLYNNRWYYINIYTVLGNTRLEINQGSNVLESVILGNGTYRTSLWRTDLSGDGDLIIGQYFTGCIQQGPGVIFENNNAIQPIGVSWSNTSCPVDTVTCNTDDNRPTFCWSSPCQHGATCIEETNSYRCKCPHLYNGTNCETDLSVYGCAVSPCLNNGTCNITTNPTRNYQCQCVAGFNGVNCEVNINECGQNPCQHGGICKDGINSFTCNCSGTGYNGSTCQSNIDECSINPSICKNGGTCYDTPGSYDCSCPPGYQDKNCEELDECLSHPCKNGATCHDLLNSYRCDCVPGYTDKNCQTDINDCVNVTCQGNFVECQDRVNSYACVCKAGYTGTPTSCTEIMECTSNPCQNGATCREQVNGYLCDCAQGYNGTNCENDIDDCIPNPCQNGAQCTDSIADFTCSCLPGYADKTCDSDINECSSNPCQHGATCSNLLNAFKCDCIPGWTGTLCETDINECSPNPCENGATCHQYLNYYNCTCAPGYTGKNCSVDINDCSPNPCQNEGSCQDRVNGYECLCHPDWMGKNCTEPYNACAFSPCKNGATCMTESPKHEYNCTCAAGFEDENCSTNIDDCKSNPCTAPYECFDGIDSYKCACRTGYTGVNCTEEINECASNPCKNGATCLDQEGNYTCVCVQGITNLTKYVSYPAVFLTGFKGRNCEEDIDECAYDHPICLNNGLCVNRIGHYQCYCGGEEDGDGSYTVGHNCEVSTTYCQVAEEAKNDPPACHHGGNCTASQQTFTCSCAPGYTDRRCKTDIDECQSNPCRYNGTCHNLVAAFSCTCIPGITGEMCEIDIDECASKPCLNGGQCKDLINGLDGFDPSTLPPNYTVGYECNCTDTGFNGTECQNNIDDCASNPCQHGSTCSDGIKDYNCTCYPGYTGKNCEIDIDECASTPCQYNGTCLEHSKMDTYVVINSLGEFSYANASGYSCQCISGITGPNCEINIDDCVNNTCQHGSTCKDLIDDYMCLCAPGYEGDMCEIDIDECVLLKACKNGATCTDRVADYDCTCSKNKNTQGQLFSGKNCTFELTACYAENNPRCQNDAICHPYLVNEFTGLQNYTCECRPGFTGFYCNVVTTASFNGQTSSIQKTLSQTTNNTISFRFRTTLPSVILFVWQGTSSSRMFLHLEIINGRLQMFTATSSDPNKSEFSYLWIPMYVNDSNWHEAVIQQTPSHIILTLNSVLCKDLPDRCIQQTTYLSTIVQNKVFFGNSYNNFSTQNTRSKTHFKGCMEDIKVNSEVVLPTGLENGKVTLDTTLGCPRQQQCFANTCSGHGTCYDFWNIFQCDCHRPYIGTRCEEEWKPATFAKDNSVSDVRFDVTALQQTLQTKVDLSLFLRTREEMGLAVFLGNSGSSGNATFMTVEIFKGYLASRLVLCNTKRYLVANKSEISDGKKHFVGVKLSDGKHQLLYDGQVVEEENISTGSCNFVGEVCYIGGKVPDSLRRPQSRRRKRDVGDTVTVEAVDDLSNISRYKGTIQDLQLNSNPMPFFSPPANITYPSTSVVLQDQTGLVEGEKSDDICNNTQPCMNNATCTNEFFNDFSCKCPPGFRGKNCSELDFCHDNSCPATATCQSLNDGFECISVGSFNGPQSAISFKPVLDPNRKISEISMKIRTIVRNGHIFTISKDSYFIHFQLVGGKVTVICKLGQATRQTFMADLHVADKRWHTVVLKELTDNITLTVVSEFENISSAIPRDGNTLSFTSLIMNATHILLGKNTLDSTSARVQAGTQDFRGCIKEPRIDGILLPFYSQDKFVNFTTQEYFSATQMSGIDYSCVEGGRCGADQCKHGSKCVQDYYGYTCDCAGTGYEGFWCHNNIQNCAADSCSNSGMCVDMVSDFRCKCRSPYYGNLCQNVTTVDEVCNPDPCGNNAPCELLGDDYFCNCSNLDFVGRGCNVSNSAGCSADRCANGGTCTSLSQSIPNFNCTCPLTHTGQLCETLLDYCTDLPCQNGGSCTSDYTAGSFSCQCQPGYTGDRCETDIDECSPSPCKNNGSCTDIVNDFICNCTDSWMGPRCTDNFNECLTQPCQHNGTCTDVIGSFKCDCKGYTGVYCEKDYDECTETPCANGGTCINLDGTYDCNCTLGYKGDNCTVPDCSEVNCNNGTCALTPNGTNWICNCNKYYYGKFCDIPGPCASNPCYGHNTVTCADIDVTNQTYQCTCTTGWEGQNCDIDIDECTRNNPCLNGATCNNTQGSYICNCAPGYTGRNCDSDIDECASQPCKNEGQCINEINQYTCNCSGTGYTGITCMEDINECLAEPCMNEGTCVNNNGSYSCVCKPGYISYRCEVADPSYRKLGDEGLNVWIIIGPVVAGVLILLIIIVIIFLKIARSKRATRGTYNPSRQEVIGSRVELGNVMKPPPEERLI